MAKEPKKDKDEEQPKEQKEKPFVSSYDAYLERQKQGKPK